VVSDRAGTKIETRTVGRPSTVTLKSRLARPLAANYFDDSLKTTELCILNSSWQILTIKRMEFDFDAYTVEFDNIASTPGAHLQYSTHTFDADGAIRVLSRYGFKLTKRLSNMDWNYDYVVQC
jgi:hypothetical protein